MPENSGNPGQSGRKTLEPDGFQCSRIPPERPRRQGIRQPNPGPLGVRPGPPTKKKMRAERRRRDTLKFC